MEASLNFANNAEYLGKIVEPCQLLSLECVYTWQQLRAPKCEGGPTNLSQTHGTAVPINHV